MSEFITCNDCEEKWISCPFCKKSCNILITQKIKVKKTTKIIGVVKPKRGVPMQQTPITINNFFVKTKGNFEELFSMPPGFNSFFKSKGSEYFKNKDETILIRISDHWGSRIRYCSWYLKGYKKTVCFAWAKTHGQKIGMIKIKDLTINNEWGQQFEPESRHPF